MQINFLHHFLLWLNICFQPIMTLVLCHYLFVSETTMYWHLSMIPGQDIQYYTTHSCNISSAENPKGFTTITNTFYKGLIPFLFSAYASKPSHIALHSFHLTDLSLLLHNIQKVNALPFLSWRYQTFAHRPAFNSSTRSIVAFTQHTSKRKSDSKRQIRLELMKTYVKSNIITMKKTSSRE